APLSEVARTLSNVHGRKIVIQTPGLDTLRYRGNFEGTGLEASLEVLSLSMQLTFEDQDSLILVKKK
ncbi:MAG: DUF4974 domain-containing protein, partial [Bacteroidota bacterium]